MVADDDEGDPALTIDQDSDLTAYFEREFTKGLGKFRRNDIGRRGTAPIQVGEAADLVGLEPTCVAVDFDGSTPLLSQQIPRLPSEPGRSARAAGAGLTASPRTNP